MNYTVEEVAKKLKVSKGHIYRLIKRGQLSKVPCLGRTVRISSSALKNIQGNSNTPENVEVIPQNTNSAVQIFKNPEFGQVRVVLIENQTWFVGKDVAEILGYKDTAKALRTHVDEEDKGGAKCPTLRGIQNVTIINEPGLYSLIFASKLPAAKKFKRWVTSDVLPTIRQTGGYIQKGRQAEFVRNYFNNLDDELKALIAKNLKSKNAELEDKRARIDKQIDTNNRVLIQIGAK